MNSVSYALDLKDFDALTRAVEKKRNGRLDWFSRGGIPVVAAFLALVPVILRLTIPSLPLDRNAWFIFLGGAVLVLCIGSLNFIARIVGRQRFRKGPYFGSEAQVVLEESGVRTRGVNGEALLFWTHILRVEETNAHIFLYVTEKQAVIAPKRAFSSPADAQNFGALAQKFWSEAHPNMAPPIAAPR